MNNRTMAQRSTRNKIRFQAISAWEDMKRAQEHMLGIVAIADERSAYIDDHLPTIITAHESIMMALEKFNEGL